MRTRRWDFISDNASAFGVQRICRVLEVSRSGYYRWLAGAEARAVRQAADDALVAEIREIHTGHKGMYGVRRVHAELRGFGHTVNRKRVERLMRRHRIEGRTCGVESARPSRTSSRHRLRTSSNATSPQGSWTRSGAATSHMCRSEGCDCISPASWTSAHAGYSATRWPPTCGPNWSSTP